MPVAPDPHPSFGAFAHPQRLVSTEWLSAHIGAAGLAIVESNADALLYDIGHIPGAVKIDWRTELTDQRLRDVVDGARFAELMRIKGIAREDTVVVYGDRSNGSAAATAWVFDLFGHSDVRLLDGGRDVWIAEARETTFEVPVAGPVHYGAAERDDSQARAFLADIRQRLADVDTGTRLLDVRVPEEYAGVNRLITDRPEEQSLRAGHIPTAVNIPWTAAVGPDGRFRTRAELEQIYAEVLGAPETIVYSRIGEHSAHSRFVLTALLGAAGVRNYDGSWTEWANAVRSPIVTGTQPGEAPAADQVAAGSG
ncbi:MAG: sulfurtransferase [Nocardia sp.]|nr:sulfurtransferase [Nocardia sp.]